MALEETPPELDVLGIEKALRYLGQQKHGVLVEIIEHGLEEPAEKVGSALRPLTGPLRVVGEWTAKERALALWAVIEEGVRHRGLGPSLHSRLRHAVAAGLRLPIEGIPTEAWGASLRARFTQLREFPAVFGEPSTTQPMEAAWTDGVKVLATYLGRRFAHLRSVDDWEPYRPHDKPVADLGEWIVEYDDRASREHAILRRPSDNAQKAFAELVVVTVHMRGRWICRRVTERLVTCRDPHGDFRYYTATGYSFGDDASRSDVPVRSLWGCRGEIMAPLRPADVPVTRLWFPQPLRYGEQAHFASEAVYDHQDDHPGGPFVVDVEIDHHGIARGRLLYGQKLPIRGLTIRITFDDDYPPEAVWWYAETTQSGRYAQPPAGDRHLLRLVGNAAQHTFTEHVCQPREHYGLGCSWPVSR